MKKCNFIFDLFNWILLALPLIFVIGTLVYTQSNPNAKDSYYGEVINDKLSNIPTGVSDFPINKEYTFLASPFNQVVENCNLVIDNFIATLPIDLVQYSGNVDLINFSYDNANARPLLKFYSNGVLLTTKTGNNNYNLSFELLSLQGNVTLYDKFTYFTYNDYSFLNNALPYAMDQFNQVGFNKIDFVHFFTDLFIDSSSLNNVYVTFINSYMNYILFTELAVFIPSVFLWIIHLFKHLGMDFLGRKEN